VDIKDGVAFVARGEEVDLEQLQAGMVDSVRLELIRPIKVGGDEVTEVTFEEPTGRHVEQMTKAGTAKAMAEVSFRILGECVGLGPEEVKDMRSRDLVRLSRVLEYFLPDARPRV
jgi:hypothetical protein